MQFLASSLACLAAQLCLTACGAQDTSYGERALIKMVSESPDFRSIVEHIRNPKTPRDKDEGYIVPIILLLAGAIAGRRSLPVASAWRLAQAATTLALTGAVAALLAGVVWPVAAATGAGWSNAFAVVLVLVMFIGWVIARYSASYLAGEPGQHRFMRWLLATLAGASLVVVTDNFAVLVAAWLGTSLSLQNLLTFYADRTQAQMAAHKKFLVSRLADVCMITAALLLLVDFGSLPD